MVLLVIGFLVFANIKVVKTPLHWAAAKNMAGTAQLLLTLGANVNAKNSEEATPLHYAAWHNATETDPTVNNSRSRDLRQGHIESDTATLGSVEQYG